jgi:hypothetical protein
VVDHFARFWRADGHSVEYLHGTKRFVPADIVFVHINLSVVPDEYLDFAARYPIAVNGRVRDIRKSAISDNLVRPGDPWEGPVIVKSDLNYSGGPERILGQSWLGRRSRPWRGVTRVAEHLTRRRPPFLDWRDYLVFDRLSDVPERWLQTRGAVVERFRPEVERGLFHLRMYQFLGDRWRCTRIASPDAILKAETSIAAEQIQPHAEVLAWRARLNLDYGKLDYVVNDGEAVLIDVNKTTGATNYMDDVELEAMRRQQAEGLYSYFR